MTNIPVRQAYSSRQLSSKAGVGNYFRLRATVRLFVSHGPDISQKEQFQTKKLRFVGRMLPTPIIRIFSDNLRRKSMMVCSASIQSRCVYHCFGTDYVGY